MVVKRSGQTGALRPGQALRRIKQAVAGSPVEPRAVEALAAEIEEEARAAGAEVSSQWLGVAVLERLRALDPVSYLRYASVYQGFESPADFERAALELRKTTKPKRGPARISG